MARCTTSRASWKSSPFIHLGAKSANQVLIEVTHYAIRHSFRMQVDTSEVLANLEENASLIETNDGVREIELLEDDASVVRRSGRYSLGGSGGSWCYPDCPRRIRKCCRTGSGLPGEAQVNIDPGILECGMRFTNVLRGLAPERIPNDAAG